MERNRREEMWKRKAEKQRIRNASGNAYWGSLAAHSTHTLYYTITIPYHTIPYHTISYYTTLTFGPSKTDAANARKINSKICVENNST